jgi:hypothetical protein
LYHKSKENGIAEMNFDKAFPSKNSKKTFSNAKKETSRAKGLHSSPINC